jgi:hypothetical protein
MVRVGNQRTALWLPPVYRQMIVFIGLVACSLRVPSRALLWSVRFRSAVFFKKMYQKI